ncbi:MAG: type IV pilus modification PilV family protein, partial [Patescibacteria group bacterium]
MVKQREPKKQKDQLKRGFTLVEALVAFSILAISLGAFVSTTVTSMKAFRQAENHHLAAKMAMEGIEMAINKRDNYRICALEMDEPSCPSGTTWREDISDGDEYEVSAARPEEVLPGENFSEYND